MRDETRQDMRTIARALLSCGSLLFVSIFVFSGIVTLSIKGFGSFSYQGTFIYAMATYVLYATTIAIISSAINKHLVS